MPPAPSSTIWTTSAYASFWPKPAVRASTRPARPLPSTWLPGIIHGARTLVMQDADGQIQEPYSISAGLDYPGVGPLHAHLASQHRAQVMAITDSEALHAAYELTRLEGIIPALESAHALAALHRATFKPQDIVVLTVSGRGDKDMDTYLKHLNEAEQ